MTWNNYIEDNYYEESEKIYPEEDMWDDSGYDFLREQELLWEEDPFDSE